MTPPSLDTIFKLAKTKGYRIFESGNVYNYNLNLWGFRSLSKDTTHFNDLLAVFYQDTRGKWSIEYFTITTDPSDIILKNPINADGTAILCEGFHKALWSYGFHKNRRDHKALVQYSPCTVYRDNDRDDIIDDNLKVYKGIFGINMHRASKSGITPAVGLYSAGCQVHQDYHRYNKVFIPLVERCVREGNKTFSYTLINEKELV